MLPQLVTSVFNTRSNICTDSCSKMSMFISKNCRTSLCKGARITHLHLGCTTSQHFTTTDSINRDEATVQAFENCHVVASKLHIRDLNPMSRAIVTLQKQNKASCHAKKKTDFFIDAKCQNQATTHASTTERFFVFLILSYSNVYIRVQALPRHAWRLRMETG